MVRYNIQSMYQMDEVHYIFQSYKKLLMSPHTLKKPENFEAVLQKSITDWKDIERIQRSYVLSQVCDYQLFLFYFLFNNSGYFLHGIYVFRFWFNAFRKFLLSYYSTVYYKQSSFFVIIIDLVIVVWLSTLCHIVCRYLNIFHLVSCCL